MDGIKEKQVPLEGLGINPESFAKYEHCIFEYDEKEGKFVRQLNAIN